jgi:lipid II:glycine glycyltransferase (peptidoglycan interpeptide bridge formation enzyme)
MTIFEIDPLQDSRWRAFLDQRRDVSVFHRIEWLWALKSCYGYKPYVLSSSPPDSPLRNGMVLCEVCSRLTGNRLVSLPFSDHCEPLVADSEELDLFFFSLTKKVDDAGWKYAEMRPVIAKPSTKEAFATSSTYYLHRLNLLPSEELLFKNFHKDSVQRKIRRAERESLRYEEGCSDVLLNHFYRLLIMTRRRHRLPPQPLKWFRTLIASLGKKLKIRVAFKGEIPVASIMTISDSKTMVYKYGCSDTRFNNLGGTAMLFWRAIQDAKSLGVEEFDFGRSDTSDQGLVTFKEHWSAVRTAVNYWRYPPRAASLNSSRAMKYIERIISVAPDSSLVMLGNLLYRHIG